MTTCTANLKALLPLLTLLCVQSVNLCAGTLSASATFTDTEVSPGVFQYDLTLNDTGTTGVGTFWFGWVPGDGFMTVAPTAVQSPTGWTEMVTNGGGAIQWVDSGALSPGSSQSGFEFDSTLTPSQLEGPSVIPSDPVDTSFAYIGAPFGDPGFQFVATPAATAPEPATILLVALGIGFTGLTARKRTSPQARR